MLNIYIITTTARQVLIPAHMNSNIFDSQMLKLENMFKLSIVPNKQFIYIRKALVS